MRLRWLPLWVLAAGLALTTALGLWSYQREAAQHHLQLVSQARGLALALDRQVQSYLDTVPGLRVFGMLQQAPSDAEFEQYVRALSLQERYPGLALSFMAERVTEGGRAAFETRGREDRSVRPDGHPGFGIVPAGPRPEYMVLRHLYPLDPLAFGYDLFDPAQSYRPAVEAAIDTGQYVATGPLQLARDRYKPADPALTSIVVRAALYQGSAVPATVAERRQRTLGVVGIGFRIQPLVRSVLTPELAQALRVRLVDEQARAAGRPSLLFDSASVDASEPVGPATASGPQAGADRAAPVWTEHIAVADRRWTLTAHRQAGLAGQDSTWILVVFGAGLSLALAALTRALVQANLGAEARLSDTAAALRLERDQLRQSEARFRMLFEHSFDAVLRTRPDGTVLEANAAACRLFGGSEDELQRLGRERLVDPSDERLGAMLAERRRCGRTAGALRLRRIDGSVFEADVASSVYLDSDGLEASSLIVRDVTEQQRLGQRLQERQRLEAIGTLAGGVAHDFNNMLGAILGNVALAEAEIDAGSPAQSRLQLVRRAAQRARSLVRQILTFSRRAPRVQAVQALQPLVDEAIALLRSTLPPNVRLAVQPAGETLWARVDGAQMQQVVLNLCTNAWQALPPDGGEVRVRLERVLLDQAAAQALGLAAGDCAALHVEDDGSGIDEAVRARIFEPFFTTKPPGEGTGLGLPVVHGVVTESGGAIQVDSAVGRGTRVTVYLPLAAPPQAAPGPYELEAPEAPEAPAGGAVPADAVTGGQPGCVLYVDDDEVVSLTAQALLVRAGIPVELQADAQAAVQAVQHAPERYAVLVTDFNMPGLSGLAVAEQALRAAPGLRVILITGHVTAELQARARTLGVSEVLHKEAMMEDLVAAVARALAASGPA